MSWQKIETAPKDGTKVLVFQKGNPNALWDAHKKDKIKIDSFKNGNFYKKSTEVEYTHWQYLPEPPAEGGGDVN